MGGSEQLFVWDEWVEFFECRKAAIAHEHFASRSRLQGEAATNIGPYLHFLEKGWRQTEGLADRIKVTSKLVRTHCMTAKMEQCMEHMPSYETSEVASLKFPPTLTPLTTYLDTITQADRLQAGILSTDFTRTSINYLLQPQEMLRSAKCLGLPVKYCHGTALKSYLVIPPVDCNQSGGHKVVTVQLKDYGEATRPAEDCEDVFETSIAEARDKLVLFIPHRHYWLLECDDHTEGVAREFETRVIARLSDTFQWVLTECSAMLEMSTKELYSQIVKVESLMIVS